MKSFFYILFICLSFYGCSDKSSELANDWCSCMKRSGLSNALSGSASFGEFDMKSPCFDELGKEMYDLLKGMTNDQRARFMKSFSQELLETDCADMVFNLLPYDEIINEFARKYDKKENDFSFNGFGNQMEICKCIDLDRVIADKLTVEKCDRMQKEFNEKYRHADVQGKQELAKIIEDCERLREGLTEEE